MPNVHRIRFKQLYQQSCENPVVCRDMPPIAGRITWARQLMRRIRDPMNVFEKHPSCLSTQEAQKVINTFNRVAAVLMEYEMVYHKAWLEQVEIARTSTYLTLLPYL